MLATGGEAPAAERRYPGPTRFRWLLAAVLVGAVAGTAWSDPAGTTAQDRQIAIAVANKLARNHLWAIPSTAKFPSGVSSSSSNRSIR